MALGGLGIEVKWSLLDFIPRFFSEPRHELRLKIPKSNQIALFPFLLPLTNSPSTFRSPSWLCHQWTSTSPPLSFTCEPLDFAVFSCFFFVFGWICLHRQFCFE